MTKKLFILILISICIFGCTKKAENSKTKDFDPLDANEKITFSLDETNLLVVYAQNSGESREIYRAGKVAAAMVDGSNVVVIYNNIKDNRGYLGSENKLIVGATGEIRSLGLTEDSIIIGDFVIFMRAKLELVDEKWPVIEMFSIEKSMVIKTVPVYDYISDFIGRDWETFVGIDLEVIEDVPFILIGNEGLNILELKIDPDSGEITKYYYFKD